MQSFFITTSPETKIHFTISKPPSIPEEQITAPLLVFLHYWGGSSATWHKLTSYESPFSLSNEYPCVAIDLRGWGQSTGPLSAPDHAITPTASDVISVLTHLNTDPTTAHLFKNGIIIVGHSMGAKVALATLNRVPDASLGLVKGLVLVAPSPPTPLFLPPHISEQQRGAYNSEESIIWTAENILSSKESLSDDDISTILRDSSKGNTFAKDGWLLHGMQEDISLDLKNAGLRPAAEGLKIEVLAGELDIVEEKDRVEQEVVQALRSSGFHVNFTVLKGVRHLVPLEDPEKITHSISYIISN
jgi:pimeloyl-ACP methyl ester carboxylesterase